MAKPLQFKILITAKDFASKMFGKVARGAATLGRGAGRLAMGGLRMFGGAIKHMAGLTLGAATAAYKLTVSFGDTAHELVSMTRRTTMTAEALQELRYAAKQVGVDQKVLDRGLVQFNSNWGKARLKVGALYTTLKKGSPAWAKQIRSAQTSEEAFTLVVEALGRLKNAGDRTALAQAAFGRQSTALVALAEKGAAGLEDYRRAARDAGIVTGDQVQSGEKLWRANQKLHEGFRRLKIAIGAELAPVLVPLLERWAKWLTLNKRMVTTRVVEMLRRMGAALRSVNWDAFWVGLQKALDISTQLLAGFLDVMGGILSGDLTTVVAGFGRAWDAVKGPLGQLWEWIKSGFMTLMNELGDMIAEWAAALPGRIWDATWKAAGSTLAELGGAEQRKRWEEDKRFNVQRESTLQGPELTRLGQMMQGTLNIVLSGVPQGTTATIKGASDSLNTSVKVAPNAGTRGLATGRP